MFQCLPVDCKTKWVFQSAISGLINSVWTKIFSVITDNFFFLVFHAWNIDQTFFPRNAFPKSNSCLVIQRSFPNLRFPILSHLQNSAWSFLSNWVLCLLSWYKAQYFFCSQRMLYVNIILECLSLTRSYL
jgi:hypothetical protein